MVLKLSLEKDVIVIPRSRNPNHIKTNLQFTHVMFNEDDREYLESLDGKIIVPDDGPFDSRSKPSVSDQETMEEEKTQTKALGTKVKTSVRNWFYWERLMQKIPRCI